MGQGQKIFTRETLTMLRYYQLSGVRCLTLAHFRRVMRSILRGKKVYRELLYLQEKVKFGLLVRHGHLVCLSDDALKLLERLPPLKKREQLVSKIEARDHARTTLDGGDEDPDPESGEDEPDLPTPA